MDGEKKRREMEEKDGRYLEYMYTYTYAHVWVCHRQRIFHLSTSLLSISKRNLFGRAEGWKSWKTSDAARVFIDRDIRLLVGKTPTSYYGLFWALPTLWYYNYVVIDKSIRLPSCESLFWRAQCRALSACLPRARVPVDNRIARRTIVPSRRGAAQRSGGCAECWMLNVGCWMLDDGYSGCCSLSKSGHWRIPSSCCRVRFDYNNRLK